MGKNKNSAPGRKRVSITVTIKVWDELMALAKEAGFPQNWLSLELDAFLPALLAGVHQAKADAENKIEMTEEQAVERYLSIINEEMKKK